MVMSPDSEKHLLFPPLLTAHFFTKGIQENPIANMLFSSAGLTASHTLGSKAQLALPCSHPGVLV
jgi:hypothetical protein